ncbi:hypothetical protein CDAR_278861 [Caerostris darwini]|uniref:Uncharacterized protein n=1 Tax=Caerostris darwini TaxID=1538125 RepID=A0AAV4WQ87_9ARAC|nr:hypothetical protein CDAR_278861 [Caerostris darwini]
MSLALLFPCPFPLGGQTTEGKPSRRKKPKQADLSAFREVVVHCLRNGNRWIPSHGYRETCQLIIRSFVLRDATRAGGDAHASGQILQKYSIVRPLAWNEIRRRHGPFGGEVSGGCVHPFLVCTQAADGTGDLEVRGRGQGALRGPSPRPRCGGAQGGQGTCEYNPSCV